MIENVTVKSVPNPPTERQFWHVDLNAIPIEAAQVTLYQGADDAPWCRDLECLGPSIEDLAKAGYGDTLDEALTLAMKIVSNDEAECERQLRRARQKSHAVIELIREQIREQMQGGEGVKLAE